MYSQSVYENNTADSDDNVMDTNETSRLSFTQEQIEALDNYVDEIIRQSESIVDINTEETYNDDEDPEEIESVKDPVSMETKIKHLESSLKAANDKSKVKTDELITSKLIKTVFFISQQASDLRKKSVN